MSILRQGLDPENCILGKDRPGVAAFLLDGSEGEELCAGLADVANHKRITQNTTFHAASLAKQFTALAIAILEERGAVSLASKARDFVPELTQSMKKIAIKHLLFHTSGLRDQWALWALSGQSSLSPVTTANVIELISRQRELNFPPGSSFLYCNTGYTLLAVIVERVTGISFKKFVEDEIFKPLSMNATTVRDELGEPLGNYAQAYRERQPNKFTEYAPNYAVIGSTCLVTNIADLRTWANAINCKSIFSATVWKRFLSVGSLDDGASIPYGFGLMHRQIGNTHIVYHGGNDYGYYGFLAIALEEDFAIAALSNGNWTDIGQRCLSIVDEFIGPRFHTGAEEYEERDRLESIPTDIEGVYCSDRLDDVRRVSIVDNETIAVRISHAFDLDADDGSYAQWPWVYHFTSADGQKLLYSKNVVTGHRTRLRKMPPTPSVNIADLAGVYWSSELSAGLELGVRDNSLILKMNIDPPAKLEVVSENLFLLGDAFWLTPERLDKDIIAVKVSHPRALGVLFKRVGQGCSNGE